MQGWAHTYSLPRAESVFRVTASASSSVLIRAWKPHAHSDQVLAQTNFDLDGSLSLCSPVAGRKVEIFGSFKVGKDEIGLKFFGDGEKAAKLFFTSQI